MGCVGEKAKEQPQNNAKQAEHTTEPGQSPPKKKMTSE